MIVICTRCQAKFKVAADKVGPRGAKVRCSKCQSVFVVHRDLGTTPAAAPAPPRSYRLAAEVELEPRTTPPPSAAQGGAPAPARDPFAGVASPDPFAATPLRAHPFATPVDDPFAVVPGGAATAPSTGRPSNADPLAALGLGAPLAAPAQASADPFAAGRRGADPFAASPADADPFAAPADADPFAAPADPFASVGDPFAATVTPRPDTPGLAVTDLSVLLATPERAAPAPAPVFEIAERTPTPTAPATAPGELDFSGDFDFASEPAAGLVAGGPIADLALEDRTTPGPARGARVGGGDALPAPDLAVGGAPAEVGFADPGEVSFCSDDDGSLALATDATPAPPPAPLGAAAASEPPAPAPAAPPLRDEPGATKPTKPAKQGAPEAGAARLPGGRAGRLRAAAVNAVALVALLVVALAFRVVWRGEGSVGTGGLRPSAVLGALGKDAAFAPQGVRSGLYDRARAPPVLFVRGEIVSRAAVAVRSLQVDVEIVREGRVIARGAALAGAVPTPEELHGTADAAALDALAAALRARAPAEIRPGERVPFLVAIGDAPADLAGAAVRVAAAPEAVGR